MTPFSPRTKQPELDEKLNYRHTLLIGFGFFASSLLWSLYNSFMPLILQDFISSTTLVGFIMTIDNIFGVIFQPYFGSLSDRTQSPLGKRLPYILCMAPLSAVCFFLIPRLGNLIPLMVVVIAFNFTMSVWRSPMISLMPDLTPDRHWSQANGVINLMGGIGSIMAFLIGGKLVKSYGRPAGFVMGSLITLAAVLVLGMTIKERERSQVFQIRPAHAGATDTASLSSFRQLPASRKRRLLYILLAIFFWFSAYNAVETFFTSFAKAHLGVDEGSGAMLLAFFSVSFVIFALPCGFLAAKIGRSRSILLGLIGITLIFIPLNFVLNITAIRILLLVGGLFWAMINVNSLPAVLSLGKREEIGTYTGYYYFFSFAASIASPILFGLIRDLTGNYTSLFVYAPVCFALAFFFTYLFRQEEARASR